MTETEITQYLYSLKRLGPKLGLERMGMLLGILGQPQKSFKSVLVGGTNGKGSTAAIIYSILRSAGFSVGRYTSPHLVCLNERIVVDENEITDQELYLVVGRIKSRIEMMKKDSDFQHPTFFEFTTAVAFEYFKEKKVDFAVLEVGLGGRLDATNTVTPLVSVITNISLEHTHILGDTIEQIAYEKAGIVKENGNLITAADGAALGKIREICAERNSKIAVVGTDITVTKAATAIRRTTTKQKFNAVVFGDKYSSLELSLLGAHQLKNAACALGVVHEMRQQGYGIPDGAIRKGLRSVVWPGRLETVQKKPRIILDCAKDADAARKLADAVKYEIKPKRLLLVVSISSDKNIEEMLDALVPLADEVIITAHTIMERAADPELLAKSVAKHGKRYIIVKRVRDAVMKAIDMAKSGDTVLVTGSVFTVAEARQVWSGKVTTSLGLDFNETPKK